MSSSRSRLFTPTSGLIAIAILAGLLVTFRHYEFGTGNHVEQLPIIFRMANPNYLLNDFATNDSSGPGPRFFYSRLIVLISQVIPLEATFLLLTVLSNTLIILITSLAARDLFGKLAALLVIPIIAAGGIIELGNASQLLQNSLLPQLLAMPFCLASLWAALHRKYLLAALLALIASLIHPLAGLETGLIAVTASVLQEIIARRRSRSAFLPQTVLAVFLLGAMAAYWFSQESGERIDSTQFIQLLAYFRDPHHYVPSTFSFSQYLRAALFLAASGIGWRRLKNQASTSVMMPINLFIGMVLALCVGGYVFVEIIPSRLWMTAQTFRLLFIVNWLGHILVAASIASWMQSAEREDRFEAFVLLFSAASPLLLGIGFILKFAKHWITKAIAFPAAYFAGLLLVVIFIYYGGQRYSSGIMPLALLLLVCIIFHAVYARPTRLGIFAASGLYTVLVILILVGVFMPMSALSGLTRRIVQPPIITLSDQKGPEVEIADYVKTNTPSDALFVTPPHWGAFRYLAERAIVVDFKIFPFHEPVMLEWQQRLIDCYGMTTATGSVARNEMDANYHQITDERLMEIQRKYGITHAVLYSDTETHFNVLFATDEFRVVSLTAMDRF